MSQDGQVVSGEKDAPAQWPKCPAWGPPETQAVPMSYVRSLPLGYTIAKRSIDVVVATAALVVLAPLLGVLIALVKLEQPGVRAIYRQPRVGRAGRRFVLFKLRTMVPGAAALREDLRAHSVVAWPDFRVHDDPRVTRVGRILRRTSLDELPQLLNVVRGEMSLVGPRPTSFDADTYALWQTERLTFKPGLTGPWQVLGRDTMDFTERCRLEISFFRRPSIRRELRLLAATLSVIVRRTGVA
jgi:lipopolysaccharide/colanic/teichoic acid biosynthesis glycosyltransferase